MVQYKSNCYSTNTYLIQPLKDVDRRSEYILTRSAHHERKTLLIEMACNGMFGTVSLFCFSPSLTNISLSKVLDREE